VDKFLEYETRRFFEPAISAYQVVETNSFSRTDPGEGLCDETVEVIGFDSYNFDHLFGPLSLAVKSAWSAQRDGLALILRDGEAEGVQANILADSSGAVTNARAPRRFRVNSIQVRALGPHFLKFCRKRSTSRPSMML